MDKLSEHAIRMLEIVDGETDFFRNDAKNQADIARAVYDIILRLQMLEQLIRKDEPNCSEIPNNCEHITEDGVTCAKYPACDDCLDNPLNKVKGSERLVKGSEQTDWHYDEQDATWYPYKHEDEPQTEYERGKRDAWKIAQAVFDSTVTLYEAEDVAYWIDKDTNVRSNLSEEPTGSDCQWK